MVLVCYGARIKAGNIAPLTGRGLKNLNACLCFVTAQRNTAAIRRISRV